MKEIEDGLVQPGISSAITGVSLPAHTPGPWMVAAGPSSVVGWPVVAQRGQSICNLSWLGKKPEGVSEERFAAYRAEVHANGRLIAAAPDLLAALEEACDLIRDLSHYANNNGAEIDDEDFAKGHAAIAKAAPVKLADPAPSSTERLQPWD